MRIFLLLLVLFIGQRAGAQFMGITSRGGLSGLGVVYEYDPVRGTFAPTYHFESSNSGESPARTQFLKASDGLLYAVASGGANDAGVVFSYDPVANSYNKEADFNNSTGTFPKCYLVTHPNGKIYGITSEGGGNGSGGIFEFDPMAGTLLARKLFPRLAAGMIYCDGMVAGQDGRLYGTLARLDPDLVAEIFSYDPVLNLYTTLYKFQADETGPPDGVMQLLPDGTFIGTTRSGGSANRGTIFHFDPVSNTVTRKFEFSDSLGSSPTGFLTAHPDGTLYGVTKGGGLHDHGVIFQYDPKTDTYTRLADFTTGIEPVGRPVVGQNGKFYGLTRGGGDHNRGSLYQYDPDTKELSYKVSFVAPGGETPEGSLFPDPDGNLYGMTFNGGLQRMGSIFKYDPLLDILTNLIDLNDAPMGGHPAHLVEVPDGRMLGVTEAGGAKGGGTIFLFDPQSSTLTTKADLGGINGSSPQAGLIRASNGKYYGANRLGGQKGHGAIFEYDLDNEAYAVRHHFSTDADGPSRLVEGLNGKLYGLLETGGDHGLGALYEFDVNSFSYQEKYSFSGGDGSSPTGLLALHTNGKLYGTSTAGGALNGGTLFEFDPETSVLTKKHDLDYWVDGGSRKSFLLAASNGRIYGTAHSRTSTDGGLLYEFNPSSDELRVLKTFDADEGRFPEALMEGPEGLIFGGTTSGGANDDGTLFAYSPATGSFRKIYDFDRPGGAGPAAALIFRKMPQTISFRSQEVVLSGSPVRLVSSVSSGLPVSFSSGDPAIASISGNMLVTHTTGNVVITSSQSGDDYFLPATDVVADVTIILGAPESLQAIAITPSGFTTTWSSVYGAAGYFLDLSVDNFKTFVAGYKNKFITDTRETIADLETDRIYYVRVRSKGVSVNSDYSAVLTVQTTPIPEVPVCREATMVTPVGFKAGWHTVRQPDYYELEISEDNFVTMVEGFDPYILQDTTLAVTGLLPETAYRYRVRAVYSYGTSGTSNEVESVTRARYSQTISFPAIADKHVDDDPFPLHSMSDSGLPVSFRSGSSFISMTDSNVTIVAAGRAIIEAYQDGNDMFAPAEPKTQSFCIEPRKPVVTTEEKDGWILLTSDSKETKHWFLNGTGFSTEDTISVTESGIYTLQVSAEDCRSDFSDPLNLVFTETGRDIEMTIGVFPNPAKDIIRIFSPGNFREAHLRVIDLNGRPIFSKEHFDSGMTVDISHFSPGLYVVEVLEGERVYRARVCRQ